MQKSATPHATFALDFIWVALATAIFIGFAIGAHLSFVIGFDFPLGKGFYSFIQTHGHLQLVGWAGMFIMGISLHFLPRLASVPIAQPQWLNRIVGLMAAGFVLRSVCHSFAPYLTESPSFAFVSWLVVASGALELCGVIVYLALLVNIFRQVDKATMSDGQRAVAPFFLMMLVGWLLYASLNFALLLHMALTRNVVVAQGWNEFAIEAFIGLVLMPVAFAFSLRMFPLYLRLPAPHWPVQRLAIVYLLAIGLQLLPSLPPFLNEAEQASRTLVSLGKILGGGVIVYFVWKLDVLTRRQAPWTVFRIFQPGPERRPTRPGLPDYGEFGRFDWLVYAAYVWLVLGALFEIIAGAAVLFSFDLLHSQDASRHTYLLGFVTLLILGMAVRMIPGFVGKKQVAVPMLVSATFWLGNSAAVFRVLPLIMPMALFEAFPVAVQIAQTLFALSGALGLLAIVCLAFNLWKTV